MNAAEPPSHADADLRDQVLAWCVRRGRAEWSAGDEAAFQAWLEEVPARRQAFDAWQANWTVLDHMPADAVAALRSRLAVDKARQAAQAGAATPPRPEPALPQSPGVGVKRRSALAFAAVAGLMTVSGSAWLAWHHWQDPPLYAQAFSTQRGQQTEARLPDGSHLWLDTATRLEVSYHRGHREVRLLEGQAMFSVQPDAQRPFLVLAGPVGVRVVGTRFSVRHTPDLVGASGVQVQVEEGRVHVSQRAGWLATDALQGGAGVDLTAGQQVVADDQGVLAPVGSIPRDSVAAWRAHRISFVDTPLRQALAELERYAPTGLFVRDAAVAELRLSGTFDPRDAQTLRQVLPIALPVRLAPSAGATEVVLAKSQTGLP